MENKIEIFKEPLEILEKLSNKGAEMSAWQLASLCGLIKEYRPQKIVEVGAAAGGTSAVILNCISMLCLNTELYSVDISEKYYRDKGKKTGYLAEECQKVLNGNTNYKIFRGGVLPEFLDKIGDDIDFLILDTAHYLPGELLDFLASIPRMRDNSIVVLHDVILNHTSPQTNAYATQVLFSSVVGEKIICMGDSNPYNYPGIGIFKVNQDTKRYIENVFYALKVTWRYLPDSVHLESYRKWFTKYYKKDLIEEFEIAIKMNEATLAKEKTEDKEEIRSIYELLIELRKKENIFIYGCGTYGIKLYELLKACGIGIEGFVISDTEIIPPIGRRVEYLSNVEQNKCTFVLGMSIENQKTIVTRNNISANYICINKYVLTYLGDHL